LESMQPANEPKSFFATIEERKCERPECKAIYRCWVKSNRKFCSDVCSQMMWRSRRHKREEKAMEAVRKDVMKKAKVRTPRAIEESLKPAVAPLVPNTHIPGTVAMELLGGYVGRTMGHSACKGSVK
jgi:hypothetical protein